MAAPPTASVFSLMDALESQVPSSPTDVILHTGPSASSTTRTGDAALMMAEPDLKKTRIERTSQKEQHEVSSSLSLLVSAISEMAKESRNTQDLIRTMLTAQHVHAQNAPPSPQQVNGDQQADHAAPPISANSIAEGLTMYYNAKEARTTAARAVNAKLPADLTKILDNHVRDHTIKVHQYLRAKARVDRQQVPYDFFQDDANKGEYPSGTKPFRMPEKALEYDNVTYSKSKDEAYSITISIPAGSTLRTAASIAHWCFSKVRADVEKEATEYNLRIHKEKATKDMLLSTSQEALTKWLTPITGVDGFPLPAPDKIDPEVVTRYIDKAWSALGTRLAEAQTRKNDADEKKRNDDNAVDSTITEKKPADILTSFAKNLVDERIAQLVPAAQIPMDINAAAGPNDQSLGRTTADDVVDALGSAPVIKGQHHANKTDAPLDKKNARQS